METEHNQYIAAQEALPFLERAAMLCKHYTGDDCRLEVMPQITPHSYGDMLPNGFCSSCRMVAADRMADAELARAEAIQRGQKEYCEYDGAELDEAMECPECLRLLIENAAFRTGRSQNPAATTTLIRRVEGFENFGGQ